MMHKILLPSLHPPTSSAVTPTTIPSPSGSPGASSTFHLPDNQKRWLVVGICLHKILLPNLRSFLKPEILKHYTNLKAHHNIDKQTFPTYLKKDGTLMLNYESINNNERKHKKKFKMYDYFVKSDVDLAKLYLKPFMAMFSAFDGTCDLSAVLGVLSSATVFSSAIQRLAKDVRQDVRNEWGHCDFTKWTEIKFAKSFQLMEMFLRALNLTPTEEKKVTDDLKDWETKGMQLCLGHIVDSDLVKLIELEVSQLSNEVQALETKQEEEFKKVHEALTSVKDYIEEFKRNVTKKLQSLQTSHENLEQEVADMAEELGALQIDHRKLKDDVSSAMISLEKHDQLEGRVSALETAIENKNSTFLKSTFKAPNRIPSFYGRVEELERLAMAIEGKTAHCIISAICGLGGTGKTSLAIEHVWKYKDIYKGGVFWLSGESVPNFQNSICEIARDVGTFDEDFRKMLSATLHWLKTRSELWCIVIDNLDEYDLTSSDEMMKVLNGHWKNDTSGHIIITTRRDDRQIQEDVPTVSPETCIELGTFSEHESIQFMRKRTDRHVAGNDVEILKELSSELGYLPLALDQAAAYIKYTTVQFSRYLEQYKKQKLKTLKRSKALFPAQDTSTERIAVGTTWQLNFEYVRRLSEDYGIGKAACLIMEVSAFLSPDDIPMELINEGIPHVENSDLQDCLAFPTGATDITSILTKFSLFQRFTDRSLSVHRLVQEVIRNNISCDGKTKNVLQSGSRLLHHAFVRADSPVKVCQSFQGDSVFDQTNPPSLLLWGTLGSHATTFQGHLIDACQNDDALRQKLICTEETAFLLNEASLYLYVCRQKVKAMELQKEKLKILTSLQMTEEKISHLQYFEIPLKPMEFKLISHCMSHNEQIKVLSSAEQETQENTAKADEWRENGNLAFKKQDYQGAIDCYNVALKWSSNDCRSLCNRALCYLKINQAEKALDDCERCLRVEKHNEKALRRKAWALYEISGKQAHLIGRSRATAAIAAHVDPTALKEKAFTEKFPKLRYVEIFNSAQLLAHLLYLNVDTTFLLHDGYYDLQGAVIDKNVQFVAIDGQTTVSFGQTVVLFGSHLYAEGITFPRESSGITCKLGGSVTMLMCHISNGVRSCEDFPECNGGDGCIAALNGLEPCNRSGHFGKAEPSGVVGYPGIQVLDQCTGHFENCDIEGCGGGGILSHGEDSKLYVKGCKVHHNHQSGLEAREGGCLEAIDNDIYSNGTNGIMIGPRASASEIIQNRIYENRKEGVFVLLSKEKEVKIIKNRIYHNLQFGLSLDRCLVGIKQNDIFENGFHGIIAKIQTTSCIENNDVYGNKCGGIHMGVNFSGRVIIKSNTIRDNSGPWLIHFSAMGEKYQTDYLHDSFLPEGETRYYSSPPVVEANVIRNNEERMFHPQEKMEVIKNECAFCRNTGKLLKCSRCNVASYCSTACQENHWGKHQMLCSSLSEKYFVIVDFKPFEDGNNCISTRMFGSHLKGIGQGIKPDPKSRRRFIVKVQTRHLNCHPLQMLSLYDQTTNLDGEIQSPEVFHIIMECGVVGGDKTLGSQFTSKKAFFYATFVDKNPKKLKINLAELADYKDW